MFPSFMSKIIPYFWMPKFVEATDASARTLNFIKKIKLKNNFNLKYMDIL